MPIDATPAAHVEDAVAAYVTGEPTVDPGAGLVTDTVAKAGAAIRIPRTARQKDFITFTDLFHKICADSHGPSAGCRDMLVQRRNDKGGARVQVLKESLQS